MTSIYKQALGNDFHKLHPRIQERFGFSSEDRVASIGYGEMRLIWFSKLAALPLMLGTKRHIMFPNGGKHIPFSIDNFAYRDQYGRETVTWNRTFKFPRKLRHFDATMIFSEQRKRIVDYLGNKQHLAVDLDISAHSNGGIQIRSGEQRFYEGFLHFRFPKLLTGVANVCEWYDEEEKQYRISVKVDNAVIGTVFRYEGSFQAEFVCLRENRIPLRMRPLREEWRE
ncbi:DUF4166 domain-containing protein [Paenibacillus sp. GCM10027626]|uniref:DUF4166 domain-containing protein n=1 Tax=Paenibacillus sp. GCM10027626 TaxID=3273411 RepID=UPI00362D2045